MAVAGRKGVFDASSDPEAQAAARAAANVSFRHEIIQSPIRALDGSQAGDIHLHEVERRLDVLRPQPHAVRMGSSRVREAASTGALVVRAPELGTVAVTGRDRQSWLNGLVTSDLARLEPGVASYGLVLVKIGRIVSDAWILPAGERMLVGVPRERVGVLREHLEKYLMMEDAAHVDASDQVGWVFVHGPRAAELARTVGPLHGGHGGAVDTTGLGGGVLAAAIANVDALVEDLVARGAVEAGKDDWEALRVERYLPRFGVDFGEKNYPQEASLEKIAVSFNKGCYLGQEVVCRLEMRGHVIKKIVAVRLDGGEPPGSGAEVRSAEGKAVGTVSSAAAGDAGPLALAMIRIDFAEPGTKLEVGGRPAVVLGLR
jgi:folate-binding protein YgfZ